MKEYIDERTQAIKFDLYFSDKQIKTGYVENGKFIPFTHSRQIDKSTGEKMLMYRIALRDTEHRKFQFQNQTLNQEGCFIQVPADAVKRKVKGLTSVYTITTAWKDTWKMTVYAGDINSKSAWNGMKERIGLKDLSQCIEFQQVEKIKETAQKTEDVATLPQATFEEQSLEEIDQFFPKEESVVQKEEIVIENESEQDPVVLEKFNRLQELQALTEQQGKVIEQMAAQNQALLEQVSGLSSALSQMYEKTADISSRLNEAVDSHQETKSAFLTIKDWMKQLTSKSEQMTKDIAEVKSQIQASKSIVKAPKEQGRNER